MNIIAIIAEYNPFHQGHQYQIDYLRRHYQPDYILAVMSGNYVQRGEPAIFDKYFRAELAVAAGVDAIIELPTRYATGSAGNFGQAAVQLLNSLHCVSSLCFGSEIGQIQPLVELADYLLTEPPNFKNALRHHLKKGVSYPKARNLAVNATFKNSDQILNGSNNILAIEYLKALQASRSKIQPLTIKRAGSDYLSTNYQTQFPSASAIRKHFQANFEDSPPFYQSLTTSLPPRVMEEIQKQPLYPIYNSDFYSHYRYILERQDDDRRRPIADLSTELFNRMVKANRQHHQYQAFIEAVPTKNYNKTRVLRALLHLLLNMDSISTNPIQLDYVKLLAFRKSAAPLIKIIRNHSHLPVITNTKQDSHQLSSGGLERLEQEVSYTRIYNQIVYQKYQVELANDYQAPIRIR